MKKYIIATLITCAPICAKADDNLFPEGNFESPVTLKAEPFKAGPLSAEEGVLYIEPGDFKNKSCQVNTEKEGDSTFLRMIAPEGFSGILRTYIPLKLPETAPASVTISMRWRVSDLKIGAGAPEWAGVQNDPMFVMADGTTQVANGTLRLKENTGGEWQEVEKSVPVPAGAKMLVLQPGLYLSSGTLDVDDIKVFTE